MTPNFKPDGQGIKCRLGKVAILSVAVAINGGAIVDSMKRDLSPPQPFSEALKRLVSVPRAEIQKRIEQAPKEAASRHKKYKYVPEDRPAKP